MGNKPVSLNTTTPKSIQVDRHEQTFNEQYNDTDSPNKDITGMRTEFNTNNLRKFVDDRSIEFIWQRGYICPCVNRHSGAPNPVCPRCYGNGVAFLQPKKSNGIIQSQEKGIRNTEFGLIDTGTAQLTTKFETRMNYRDRITIPNVLVPESMVFYIDERRVKHGINLVYDVKEIELITTFDRELSKDEYTIKDNKLFVDEKFLNQTVSLLVYMTLRYMVIDQTKESRYQYTEFNQPKTKFENLPQLVLLKRENIVVNPEPLMFDGDLDSDEVERIEAKINEPMNKVETTPKRSGFFGGLRQ